MNCVLNCSGDIENGSASADQDIDDNYECDDNFDNRDDDYDHDDDDDDDDGDHKLDENHDGHVIGNIHATVSQRSQQISCDKRIGLA